MTYTTIKKKLLSWLSLTLLCLSSQAFAQHFTGEIRILVADDFKEKKSTLIYQLDTSNHTYTLILPKKQTQPTFKTGDIVTINGQYKESVSKKPIIKVKDIKILKTYKTLKQNLSGSHHTLVLLLNFEDKKATDTTSIEQVTGHMYTDQTNMRQNFLDSSFKQTDFIPDTNGDGQPDIYTINLNYSITNTCSASMWANDAKAAASAQGIDISLYKHFMFVLPANSSCGWGGLGNLGCGGSSCHTWIKWNSKIVYAHELGHNLGMHHASTDPDNDGRSNSEYGDWSGIMGNSGYRQVNAPHRIQMKWYDSHPDNVKSVSAPTSLRLFSLDKAPKGKRKQIAIVTKEGLSHAYYVSYRTNIGTFGMGEQYAKKINIHRYPGPGKRTLFIKSLQKNEHFIDPIAGLKLTAVGIEENFGKIRARYQNKCGFKNTPCPLPNNSDIENLNGKVNYFTVNVPEGTGLLTIDTSETVASPSVKLLVKFDKRPTNRSFDCKSSTAGGTQTCAIDNPTAGIWHIKISSGLPHEGITVMNQIDSSTINNR
jgi:hypothetical protein